MSSVNNTLEDFRISKKGASIYKLGYKQEKFDGGFHTAYFHPVIKLTGGRYGAEFHIKIHDVKDTMYLGLHEFIPGSDTPIGAEDEKGWSLSSAGLTFNGSYNAIGSFPNLKFNKGDTIQFVIRKQDGAKGRVEFLAKKIDQPRNYWCALWKDFPRGKKSLRIAGSVARKDAEFELVYFKEITEAPPSRETLMIETLTKRVEQLEFLVANLTTMADSANKERAIFETRSSQLEKENSDLKAVVLSLNTQVDHLTQTSKSNSMWCSQNRQEIQGLKFQSRLSTAVDSTISEKTRNKRHHTTSRNNGGWNDKQAYIPPAREVSYQLLGSRCYHCVPEGGIINPNPKSKDNKTFSCISGARGSFEFVFNSADLLESEPIDFPQKVLIQWGSDVIMHKRFLFRTVQFDVIVPKKPGIHSLVLEFENIRESWIIEVGSDEVCQEKCEMLLRKAGQAKVSKDQFKNEFSMDEGIELLLAFRNNSGMGLPLGIFAGMKLVITLSKATGKGARKEPVFWSRSDYLGEGYYSVESFDMKSRGKFKIVIENEDKSFSLSTEFAVV